MRVAKAMPTHLAHNVDIGVAVALTRPEHGVRRVSSCRPFPRAAKEFLCAASNDMEPMATVTELQRYVAVGKVIEFVVPKRFPYGDEGLLRLLEPLRPHLLQDCER